MKDLVLFSAMLISGALALGQGAVTGAAELERARALVQRGEYKDAEVELRQMMGGEPASAEAGFLLGLVLLRLDRPKESLEAYTKAAGLRTPQAEDLRHVAEDYVLLDDFDDADKWMLRSVNMDSKDAEGWYGLGRIRYSEQKFAEALSCFQKALDLSPKSVKAENNLGLAFEGLNRRPEAINAYRTALDWQKDLPHPSEQPMLNLATALVEEGQFSDAQPLLTRAVEIAPKDPKIHEQLGHLYLETNRLPEAQRELEMAVELTPNYAAYHFLLGRVYKREGLEAKAAAEFKRAADLNGTHSTPDVQ